MRTKSYKPGLLWQESIRIHHGGPLWSMVISHGARDPPCHHRKLWQPRQRNMKPNTPHGFSLHKVAGLGCIAVCPSIHMKKLGKTWKNIGFDFWPILNSQLDPFVPYSSSSSTFGLWLWGCRVRKPHTATSPCDLQRSHNSHNSHSWTQRNLGSSSPVMTILSLPVWRSEILAIYGNLSVNAHSEVDPQNRRHGNVFRQR